jgi:uncharacterized repeat protein (TIGR03803 family)
MSAFEQTVPSRNAILQATSTTTNNIEQGQQQRGGNMIKLNWVTKACGIFLLWATVAVALPAQTFTSLFGFNGTDGSRPIAGLVQGTDGNFYGTASANAGENQICSGGCGTVFKISPSGILTTLHSFDATDGNYPQAGLVLGADGDFYGATSQGGLCGGGCGTIFKITPSGTLTTLYSFQGPDGQEPSAALVLGANGDFYGTTAYGGANTNSQECAAGCGTVFRLTPGGTLTTLYSFCAQTRCNDGAIPNGLVQGADGNFYATTFAGGTSDTCPATGQGCGTIFKITPSGTLTTLHSFHRREGAAPAPGSALVQGLDGRFYGTAESGGASDRGTVFSIPPSGTPLTILYSFCPQFNCANGDGPNGLVQGTDGNFYGTGTGGGMVLCEQEGCGSIFEITPTGTVTTFHIFDLTDGGTPRGALLQATDGNFYGTSFAGGTVTGSCDEGGCGTVFSLSVGLGAFVKTQPILGKVGADVNILGTNLTGATGVTFNGTEAAFTVNSSTLITTTVPIGATTGTVSVITPSGTLSSNVEFRVRP